MSQFARLAGLSLLLLAPACDDDTMASDTGDPTSTPQRPPTDADALSSWLEDEPYVAWEAESSIHPSTGPHFGNVRTWINDATAAGLEAGDAELEVGAATVKELYGDGQTRRGWSVSVKIEAGAGGGGWYWYELYDGDVLADGQGLSVCVGCHEAGTDSVLTPFPVQ
jgi:hypothetical protein